MFSFEGDFKTRPKVSLGGASRKEEKSSLLHRTQEERCKREEKKRRLKNAIIIQSFVRGYKDRKHQYSIQRSEFDRCAALTQSEGNVSITHETSLTLLVRQLQFFYRQKEDSKRLMWIGQHLMKQIAQFVKQLTGPDRLYMKCLFHIKRLLGLCCRLLQHCNEDSLNVALPLRMIEVFVSESKYLPKLQDANYVASIVEHILHYMIKKGYYRSFYLLINCKLPSSIEYTDVSRVPTAKILLENVLKPLHFSYRSCPEGSRIQIFTAFTEEFLAAPFTDQIFNFIIPALADIQIAFPAAMFLTETWLSNCSGPDIAMALPNNYTYVGRNRVLKEGGGIAIIFKREFSCKWEDLDFPNCEAGFFKLSLTPHFTLSGTLIYRPPGSANSWASSFPELIAPLILQATNFLVVGDLNIHFNLTSCPIGMRLLQDLAALDLHLHNSGPTHKAGNLLDPIISNLNCITHHSSSPVIWSDHFTVNFSIRIPAHNNSSTLPPHKASRTWKRLNIDKLNSCLDNSKPTSLIISTKDVSAVNSWLNTALDLCLPTQRNKSQFHHPPAPWFNDSLRLEKSRCKKLERLWRSDYCTLKKANYKAALRTYHTACDTARANHANSIILKAQNRPKALFKLVKDLSGMSSAPKDPSLDSSQCNALAKFFLDKIDKIYAILDATPNAPTILEPLPVSASNTNSREGSDSEDEEEAIGRMSNTTGDGKISIQYITEECLKKLDTKQQINNLLNMVWRDCASEEVFTLMASICHRLMVQHRMMNYDARSN
ncbi:LOW QUALITY PROTEIN: uncharacterized protein LOC144821949 [Lissotriton helveticus]